MYYNQVFIDKEVFDSESKKSKENGKFTEKLGRQMIDLIRNILHSSRFKIKDTQNEVFYELEMYIIEKLLNKYLIKYDETKGNGFSLASTMVIHLTYDFLRKLKTQDATGRPKYHRSRNIVTNERDRITMIYIEEGLSTKKIY